MIKAYVPRPVMAEQFNAKDPKWPDGVIVCSDSPTGYLLKTIFGALTIADGDYIVLSNNCPSIFPKASFEAAYVLSQ